MAAWREARHHPMVAARALQAFRHASPYRRQPEEVRNLALVGGLLEVELLHNTRGLVEQPMNIMFLTDGPTVEPFELPKGETPVRPPKG